MSEFNTYNEEASNRRDLLPDDKPVKYSIPPRSLLFKPLVIPEIDNIDAQHKNEFKEADLPNDESKPTDQEIIPFDLLKAFTIALPPVKLNPRPKDLGIK